MSRWISTAAVLMMLLTACGEPVTPAAGTDSEPTPGQAVDSGDIHPDAIWFDTLGVSGHGDPDERIVLTQSLEELRAAWDRYRFSGELPEMDFAQHVVFVLTRNEDGCPDDLVEARLTDAMLETTWLPPPGFCTQPLFQTAFAIAFHRGNLPESFRVLLREGEAFGGDQVLTVELPPYDGPPAPAPSPPPRQMSDNQLAEVFAGHALRPCNEMPDYRTTPRVDGPLSSDAGIAEIQQRRAEYALPSDEGTVRTLRSDGAANRSFGFPMTQAEFDEIMRRNWPVISEALPNYTNDYPDSYAFTLVDQPAGGTLVVAFTADVQGHRQRLAKLFPDVPLRVIQAPATAAQLQSAQRELHRRFPHNNGRRPRILGSGSAAAHLQIQVLDPNREDLDAIASVIDPTLACVEATRSGLQPVRLTTPSATVSPAR